MCRCDFCNLFRSGSAIVARGCGLFSGSCYIHIDKGSQAVVLAEIAASIFVAGGGGADVRDFFEADESGLLSVAPEPQSFLCRADRSRLTAVFMDDDLRFF